MILYCSFAFRSELLKFIKPSYSDSYALRWILLFPWRLVKLSWQCAIVLVQGFIMTGFDVFWPTFTLFHGTPFDYNASSIASSGMWFVGEGNYAGTGVYFSIMQKVAEHYANSLISEVGNRYVRRNIGTPAVIVARTTLLPCRSIGTLPRKLRGMVGVNGDIISQNVKFPWASLLHWRDDKKWYEFCLLHSQKGEFINTWRIRPLCVLKNNSASIVQGGLAVWPGNLRGWLLVVPTLLLFFFPIVILSLPDYVETETPNVIVTSSPTFSPTPFETSEMPASLFGTYRGKFFTNSEDFYGTYEAVLVLEDNSNDKIIVLNVPQDGFYSNPITIQSIEENRLILTFENNWGATIEMNLERQGESLRGIWKYLDPTLTATGNLDVVKDNE
jgi:hypothetical protein